MGTDFLSRITISSVSGLQWKKVVAHCSGAMPSMRALRAILLRPAGAGPAGLRARAWGLGETCPKVVALDFLTFIKGVFEAASSLWVGLAQNRF